MHTKSYENIFCMHCFIFYLHGDGEKAFAFIEQIHKTFAKEEIEICPLPKVINSQT